MIALTSALVQHRIGTSQGKLKTRLEKLERMYCLCQAVYDGHVREINNAKLHWPGAKAKFIERRNHPGAEMSELKMLIRCYVPELTKHIESLDLGHGALKSMFIQLDNFAVVPEHFEPGFDNASAERHLASLADATKDLKAAISTTAAKLST